MGERDSLHDWTTATFQQMGEKGIQSVKYVDSYCRWFLSVLYWSHLILYQLNSGPKFYLEYVEE